jgi:hypothetical protein
MLKNLEGRFLDEVDVFEDLIYENLYESRLSAMIEVCKDFSKVMSREFLKNRSFLHQSLNSRTSKDMPFEIACKKYETNTEEIYELLTSIDSYFKRIYTSQIPSLIFVDYETRKNVVIGGKIQFQFKDDKNPNQELLNRINSISRDTTTGVKYIKNYFNTVEASSSGEHDYIKGQKILFEDILVSQPDLPKELKPV